MAKSVESGGRVEGAIGGFAEDLGRILGQARNRADSWLGQREAIVKQLTQLRDEASSLLNQLGHHAAAAGQRGRRVADSFVMGYRKRGPGRPKGSKNKKGIIIVGGKNIVPADVEEIVDHVPGVRYSAAVGVDSERTGTQRLYVVAELREAADPPTTVREIVHRVHRGQGHRPARVLLVQASTIPKTSSGKIQRSRLVQMIEAGELTDRVIE